MKLATTTGDFEAYFKDYIPCVEAVCEAGFRYVDLGMYRVLPDDSLLIRDDWRDYLPALRKAAEKYGAQFVQAHSPGGNPLREAEKYELLLKTTIRSIEVCGALGIPNIVVHQGTRDGLTKDDFFEENKKFFEKLFPVMEATGVNVLCENSTKANTGDWYWTNSAADMVEFVQYVDHPLFHACWDTGHANVEGSQYDEILRLGKELRAVHINDNRGQKDEHILPWCGTLNMDEIMHALIDAEFKGYFTFEASSTLYGPKYWLGHRREFPKDERLARPQLFMQKHIEKLLYEMGEYILHTYDVFEA